MIKASPSEGRISLVDEDDPYVMIRVIRKIMVTGAIAGLSQRDRD
ncbi:MAG: hypothetical protein RMX63_23805 [Aulosira sp. ZfuCHP01]|nr:hypothetical protein [Aulosira sp. ZfuVER01]MDZ8002733.1 hypothetical protein [Aulosira sp. DedVER01a]MDZ8054448.1 hypothetical protein [Aulosira sp. ZfuCHP01]